jgi:hypothetical protein
MKMTSKFMQVLKTPKVLITGALLLAFAAGAVFEGFTKLGSTNAAFDPSSTASNPNAATNETTSATTTEPVASTAEPVRTVSSAPRTVHHKRSWEKEALIIGGSSAAGAAIGGIAGGGKGAGIGAISGGAAGVIYDMATRNK